MIRSAWKILAAAVFVVVAACTANAMEFPRSPHLAAGPDGRVLGGYQLATGESGTFELFTCDADGGDVFHHGRFNGSLAGVAAAPDGRHYALTRDGALGVYGDEPEDVALPDYRWDMQALAWWRGAPAALNLDNGSFHLAVPGDDRNWTQDDRPIAQADRVARAELIALDGELHLLWSARPGDLSQGEIRHLILRGEIWTEQPSLLLGDVDAFSACAVAAPTPGAPDAQGGLFVAALVADPFGAGGGRVEAFALREGAWEKAAMPAPLRERLGAAHSFAVAGGSLWLDAGPEGAFLTRTGKDGAAGEPAPVAPGVPAEALWSRLAGLATMAALVLLFLLYCRRSKAISRAFPARPPDLLSRGAALGVDWFLASVATAVYHVASGDVRILPDLLARGEVLAMFWVNLIALCVFMGLSEGLFGCTPGKWLAGLHVRSALGGRPTFSQAAIRNIVRILDMYPLAGFPGLVGMVATFLGPRRQRLGDMLARTVVRRHMDLARRRFLLASASPRRLDLLRELGVEVRVQPSDIDEDGVRGATPADTVRLLSQAKARAATEHVQASEVVVAADTVVVLGGSVLGKPKGAADARDMLAKLSGKSHSVFTGVTVWDSATGQGLTDIEETEVEFRELSPGEIDAYVATGDPLDKAGAYGVQTGHLVKQVRGSLSNVAGLPMEKLQGMLAMLDS